MITADPRATWLASLEETVAEIEQCADRAEAARDRAQVAADHVSRRFAAVLNQPTGLCWLFSRWIG